MTIKIVWPRALRAAQEKIAELERALKASYSREHRLEQSYDRKIDQLIELQDLQERTSRCLDTTSDKLAELSNRHSLCEGTVRDKDALIFLKDERIEKQKHSILVISTECAALKTRCEELERKNATLVGIAFQLNEQLMRLFLDYTTNSKN